MPLWMCWTVDAEPSVTLVQWKIVEIDAGTRHFVGADSRDFTGRVSSAIQEFDATSMRGVTRSGRVYHLLGSPGDSADARYVWDQWCSINDVRMHQDVTDSVIDYARRAPTDRSFIPPGSPGSS